MSEAAEQGRRFLEENSRRLASIKTKEGTLDFQGYDVARAADELLSGTEGYVGSIAVGSHVRTYHGTSPELPLGELPDRDVVVLMKNANFVPGGDKEVFAKELAQKISARMNSANQIDCTVAYFDGARTVHHTIDNLTGMFKPDHWWLYLLSPATFGVSVEAVRNSVRDELKYYPRQKQAAIINGFVRLISEGERIGFDKYREYGHRRFSGVTDAQIEESFRKRRELWKEQIRQVLQLEGSTA